MSRSSSPLSYSVLCVMMRLMVRGLLQRASSRIPPTEAAAIRSDRTREFFKRRWLNKALAGRGSVAVPKLARLDSGVSVHLDSREGALIDALSLVAPGTASLSVSQLLEGDVVITESNQRIVIERKTIEDFYNSIKSKRLFDQIGRIYESSSKSPGVATIVVIVLEGAPSSTPAMYPLVTSMYQSLLLRDKIAILRTDSVEETARLILSLASRVGKFFSSPNEYSSLVHVERYGRKVSGLNVPYLKLLMSIHGISANRAQAIAQTYPTMDALVTALKAGGTIKLAQLVAPSSNRSVGSPVGIATAVNIAEAVLGPNNPEVAIFKLFKYLCGNVKMAPGEAMRTAKQFKSIVNLRRLYLSGNSSEGIPDVVREHLATVVDDPHTLLVGLKGVRAISLRTAEIVTQKFGTIRKFNQHMFASPQAREDIITSIRVIGTASQKRMISRAGVENILAWLESEGFIPILDHGEQVVTQV